MQGTGSSGYNGCEKMVVAAKKGDFTEHLPLPVFVKMGSSNRDHSMLYCFR